MHDNKCKREYLSTYLYSNVMSKIYIRSHTHIRSNNKLSLYQKPFVSPQKSQTFATMSKFLSKYLEMYYWALSKLTLRSINFVLRAISSSSRSNAIHFYWLTRLLLLTLASRPSVTTQKISKALQITITINLINQHHHKSHQLHLANTS